MSISNRSNKIKVGAIQRRVFTHPPKFNPIKTQLNSTLKIWGSTLLYFRENTKSV